MIQGAPGFPGVLFCPLAQLAERQALDLEVLGSNPRGASRRKNQWITFWTTLCIFSYFRAPTSSFAIGLFIDMYMLHHVIEYGMYTVLFTLAISLIMCCVCVYNLMYFKDPVVEKEKIDEELAKKIKVQLPSHLHSPAFKALDGESAINIIHTLLKKSTSRGPKVDASRGLISGLRWEDFYHADK